jgi:hypothetical protein
MYHANCPRCGHDDIASNACETRTRRPTEWTCMRCFANWNAAGEFVPMLDAKPVDDPWPNDLPIVRA